MIRSRAALVVLAGVCALLALVLAFDLHRATGPLDHALLPQFDPDSVTRLDWTRDGAVIKAGPEPGRFSGAVERTKTGWTVAGRHVQADTRAIGDVLATLRGARWHVRRAGPPAAQLVGAPRVSVWRGSEETTIVIGGELEGTDQAWLVLADHAYLVDGWVARALAPDAMSLRERSPMARATTAHTIAIERGALSVEVRGTQLYQGGKLVAWLPPTLVQELVDALAGMTYFSDAAAPAQTDTTIRIDNATVTAGGMCSVPGFTYVHADIGDGCVPELEWRRAVAAITPLLGGNVAHDPHPVPFAPEQIRFDPHTLLELGPPAKLARGDRTIAVDPSRLAALVSALANPGEPVPPPTTSPRASLDIADAGGAHVALAIHPDDIVVRTTDATAVRLPHDVWTTIAAPPEALRDPTLWIEDATTISAIAIDDVRYTRGATLGEWKPEGPADASALETLATQLAVVRAEATTERVTPRHVITLTVTPPVGDASKHVLALDRDFARSCRASVDGNPVTLGAPLCAAISRASD